MRIDPLGELSESGAARVNNVNGGEGQDWDDIALRPGDVSSDGKITSLDVIRIINRLGLTPDADSARFDVNGDGLIDALDVIFVINRLGQDMHADINEPGDVIQIGPALLTGTRGQSSVRGQAATLDTGSPSNSISAQVMALDLSLVDEQGQLIESPLAGQEFDIVLSVRDVLSLIHI